MTATSAVACACAVCVGPMGKYMRKRKRNVGRTTPAAEHGVRTRAQSDAVASTASAAAAAAPKRPRKQTTAAVTGNTRGAAAPGSCYLHLRTRRLQFLPGGEGEGEVQRPVPPLPAAAAQRSSSVASGEPEEVAGSSRCSSTASSSVDVVVLAMAPASERSGDEAEEVVGAAGNPSYESMTMQFTFYTWRR
jgi:hypothetical protein